MESVEPEKPTRNAHPRKPDKIQKNQKKNRYQIFYQMWRIAHPSQAGTIQQALANDFWRKHRHDTSRIEAVIKSLRDGTFDVNRFEDRKPPIDESLLDYGIRQHEDLSEQSIHGVVEPVVMHTIAHTKMRSKSTPTQMKRKSVDEADAELDLSPERRETPAQRRICLQLIECQRKMTALQSSPKEPTFPDECQLDQFQELQQESFELERQLKRLKDCAKRNRKCRERKKHRMDVPSSSRTTSPTSSDIMEATTTAVPEDDSHVSEVIAAVAAQKDEIVTEVAQKDVKRRSRSGGRSRSKAKTDVRGPQWQLLQTVVNVVSLLAAIDEKRVEALRACQSLDELHLELKLHGFQINRTAPYLRLLPMYWSTYDGKRHKKTVPVVVRRHFHPRSAETINRASNNDDHHFILATATFLRELVELYGPQVCFVLSHDTKVSVPLSLSSTDEHAPLLMRLDYHSSPSPGVVATELGPSQIKRQQLLPTVYAGLGFDSTGSLHAAGPTYVAIHSVRHDALTAATHARHFRQLVKSDAFRSLSLDRGGELKPVVVMFVDDHPSTAPRLPETLRHAVSLFQDHDLDALFVACHGRTETMCGAVEQRLSALSDDVAGIVLPREYLRTAGTAERPRLDRDSFRRAGQCLAEVWSESELDGYSVDARYVEPPPASTDGRHDTPADHVSESWKATHVRQSRYLLQIVKCGSPACCKPFRTNLHCYLPRGFLPPPLLVKRTERGVILCSRSRSATAVPATDGFFTDLFQRLTLQHLEPDMLPFDHFCPSAAGRLAERTCETCRLYLPSQAACRAHQTIHSQVIQKYVYSIRDKLHQFVTAAAVEAESSPLSFGSREDSADEGSGGMGLPAGDGGDDERDAIDVVADTRSWLEPAFQEIVH